MEPSGRGLARVIVSPPQRGPPLAAERGRCGRGCRPRSLEGVTGGLSAPFLAGNSRPVGSRQLLEGSQITRLQAHPASSSNSWRSPGTFSGPSPGFGRGGAQTCPLPRRRGASLPGPRSFCPCRCRASERAGSTESGSSALPAGPRPRVVAELGAGTASPPRVRRYLAPTAVQAAAPFVGFPGSSPRTGLHPVRVRLLHRPRGGCGSRAQIWRN